MSSFDENSTIYTHIKRLTEIKKAYPALRIGTQREMWTDSNVYAFSRRVDSTGEETVTVSSNSWDTQVRNIPIRAESSLQIGDVLTNLMNTSDTVKITSGGITGKQILVTLGEHESKIYAPGVPVSNYVPGARNTTIIRVHYDAGWGHSISIRGDSYPLSWTSGRGARNLGSNVWEFELERIPQGSTFSFKPLIDDSSWSTGDNYVGTGGTVINIYPNFQ